MTKQTIHISAIDTLFFRDGKPFERGEETWAQGIFPPQPSVFYGALRGAFLFQNSEANLSNIEDLTKNLQIENLYLLINDEPHFIVGEDIIRYKKDGEFETSFLELSPKYPSSNGVTSHVLESSVKEKVKGYGLKGVVNKRGFRHYLQHRNPRVKDLGDYLVSEPKVGIGRNDYNRATGDGMLYRVGMRRLAKPVADFSSDEEVKLVITFSGLSLDKTGIIKLGAEGKTANYITNDIDTSFELKDVSSKIIRIYLATPGIFPKNGWHPEWMVKGTYKSISFELMTVALGKSDWIGGFDMKENKPKDMYRAVPAGSVYYLKANSKEDAKQLYHALNERQSILDDDEISQNFTKQGYGLFYIGTLK